ncbi:polysaccharide deacetylase family protein [Rhizobium sp. SG_E_25_P2]|uniref:polysaccharide deacetylase family protein n=1 Tax=Rhizobium sp. SG_E_25_P2 TaxID=2879942 RepID=UPI00247650B6|nr:polysaccharide deacetylase family protein [Rhizobium sp. SG_E_25_P2]
MHDMAISTARGLLALSLIMAQPVLAETPETPTMPAKPLSTMAAKANKAPGPHLLEPKLVMARIQGEGLAVALTFDACMGATDARILDMLIANEIPATIFVTARWLKRNPEPFSRMLAHPDLFEIENHGENHVPAVDRPVKIYGIAAAGSPEAVAREVEAGAEAIVKATGKRPTWFRGATAKYTRTSIQQIQAMGFEIAGYSVNGDGGSLLGASVTAKHFASARDGDVIIAHINQPSHAAGDGVVKGVLSLKARGYRFLKLSERRETLTAKGL